METCIGKVTHYFNRLGVAVLSLSGELNINDMLHFFGHSTDFYQKAWSMEIDHKQVHSVPAGAEVALMVAEPVREGDQIFHVVVTEPAENEALIFEQIRDWEINKS